MKTSDLALYTHRRSGPDGLVFPDFLIGKIKLAKHLGAGGKSVLAANPRFARQLLLKEPSGYFADGRVPLYVCHLCEDLACGALTVKVEQVDGCYVWSDFGSENLAEEGFRQTEYEARTGPFVFDASLYEAVIHPYSIR